MVLEELTSFLIEDGMGCFTSLSGYSVGNGFIDGCL
jgi:hypothetical protein